MAPNFHPDKHWRLDGDDCFDKGDIFAFKQPPSGFATDYYGGGGKGGTTTQTVSIPPEVLARYNAVNARAEDVAKQPFQQYGGQFVAGLTPTQQAGQQATSAYSQSAQPYFNAATGLTLSGTKDVGPLTKDQIGYYQDPAMLATLAPTQAALQQQQGQQLAQQQAEAIRSGAFGGSGYQTQRNILRGQQQLGMGQALAPIYQQAYQTGLSTAQQQQGVVAQDLARRMQGAQQIAGLGTAAQQAGLQGAQAQMAAGQVEQQTQQADLTARYQQFLQERGYPFQVAQFLANIAMGTGALSGSTTTTQAPGGFFSDRRLKHDVKEVGKTHDGQPIYSYKYNGDDRTQLGLMAQDVEKKHPEAVGLMGGYKTVDYKKATKGAERTHKDMGGGLMPSGFDSNSMGGAVMPDMAGQGFERGGYVGGGLVGPEDWSSIIAANKAALGMYGGAQPMGGPIGAGGIVPQASIPTPKLVTAGALPQQRPSGMSTAMQTGKDIAGTYKGGKEFLLGSAADKSAGLIGGSGELKGKSFFGEAGDFFKDKLKEANGGLIVARHGYATRGSVSEGEEDSIPYDPSDVMGGKDPLESVLKAGSQKHEMLKPGQAPGQSGGSGLGNLAGTLGAAKGLYGMGSDIMGGLGSLGSGFSAGSNAAALDSALGPGFFAGNIGLGAEGASAAGAGLMGSIGEGLAAILPFSDERLKSNIRPVGKTFDGQNIYSYNIGNRPTQMGLMAQEVLDRKPDAVGHIGKYLTVDYDRATEDASPYAGGGLVPRQAHADGERVIPAQADEIPVEQPVDDRLARTLGALKRIESGGRSDIVGPASRTGDRPYGLYQVMGANIPSWTEAALGRRMTPEEFRLDPKAQEATAMHRAGLYMNQYDDPRQVASMWFTGKPIEKAGNVADVLGTTNPRYLAMFDRYYGGKDLAPSEQRAAGPVNMGEAASRMSGGEGKKSLGDVVTSEGFLVPALGFLGSMLASNRPSFGGALGEGIVGGVGAYQAQRKQDVEMARDLRTMFDQRFIAGTIPNDAATYGSNAGKRGFLDKNTQRWVTPEEMSSAKLATSKQIGIPPALVGVSEIPVPQRPLTPAEAMTQKQTGVSVQATGKPEAAPQVQPSGITPAQPAEKPAEAPVAPSQAQPSPVPNMKAVTRQSLIDEIRRGGPAAYKAAGLDDPAYDPRPDEAQLSRLKEQVREIPTGTPEHDKTIQEMRQLQADIDRKYGTAIDEPFRAAQQNYNENKKWFEEQSDAAIKRQDLRAKINRMEEVLNTWESGKGASKINDIAAMMKTIGIPVPESAMVNPTEFQKFLKDSMSSVFDEVRSLGGQIRVAEITGLQKASPDPEAQPGANRSILARGLGALDWMDKYYSDAVAEQNKDPYRFNRTNFVSNWVKQNENSHKQFVEEAYKNIAPRGDVPVKNGAFDPSSAKPGHTYIVEPGMGIDAIDKLGRPAKVKFIGLDKDGNAQFKAVR